VPGVGYPDLHVTFRSVRDWDSVLKKGSFGGVDRDVTVEVGGADVRAGKRVVYDFDRECRVDEGEGRPGFGIAVEAGEFRGLLGGGERGAEEEGSVYPSPPVKRRRVERGGEGKSLCVKLIGIGPSIPGHPFRADINVNFVLKP
jgi:hypothetical protein